MLTPCKDTQKALDRAVETVACVLRGKAHHLGLRSNDELELRDEIHHELSIGTEGVRQGLAPQRDLRIALAEHVLHQLVERLGKRRIGNVSLVLVEFARREESPR